MATTTNGQRRQTMRRGKPADPDLAPFVDADPATSPGPAITGSSLTSPTAARPTPTRPVRRRRWSRIALAVILVVVCGLGGAFLYQQSSRSVEVIAIRVTVPRGTVVTAADLTAVTIGQTPGIATVPASQLAAEVGQIARYDLVAGSLLNADALTTQSQPDPNRAQVGLRLQPGQIPTESMLPGTPVNLVYAPAASTSGNDGGGGSTDSASTTPVPAGIPAAATVVSERSQADGDAVLMTVDVDAKLAPTITALAAAGNLGVIRVSDRH